MSFDTPESPLQPGMGERAIDAATEVSRTVTEVSNGLRAAINRLSDAIAASRRPGGALASQRGDPRGSARELVCRLPARGRRGAAALKNLPGKSA